MRFLKRSLAGVVLLMGLLIVATPAQAEGICDSLVFDGANQFGDRFGDVQAAAEDLASTGADVHVITVDSIGSAESMKDFQKQLEQQCSSWQNPDGGRKANLVTVIESLKDRRVVIYYGEQWQRPLEANGAAQRIQGEVMGPAFRAGDFATGFINGINEVESVIDNFLHPSDSGSGTTVINNGKPTDLSGLWKILGVLLALVVLGALIYAIWHFVNSRRIAREELNDARQNMKRIKLALTGRISQLDADSRQELLAAKAREYGQAAPDIAGQYQKMVELRRVAVQGMADLAGDSAFDEENLSADGFDNLAGRYQELLDIANEAVSCADAIDMRATELRQQIDNFPKALADAEASLTAAAAEGMKLEAEGFKAQSVGEHLARAADELSATRSAGANPEGIRLLNTANAAISVAASAASDLRRRRDDLAARHAQLETEVAAREGIIADAAAAFGRISSEYAPSSWESVRGNGTEATKRLVAAQAQLVQSQQLGSMDVQDWEQAEVAAQSASTLLEEVDSLTASITSLEENLALAKASAAKEIQDAADDLDKARDYLHQFAADVRRGLESDLSYARDLLNQARQELSGALPNYILVVELATKANSQADQIYDNAVADHEAAERQRRLADTTLQQAQAATSKADGYIEDHDRDVKSSAKQSLGKAKEHLASAMVAADPGQRIAAAQKAEQHANKAYQSAASDFKSAEAKRKAARAQSRANDDFVTGLVIGSSMSHHHDHGSSHTSSWGSDSGSNTSFDFGGGGGGSDTSFDSGGGGGGSDSGW